MAVIINPPTLPNGTVGVLYSQTLTASGETSPYSFAVTAGTPPPGILLGQLPPDQATLLGIPTAAGTYVFTITATYALGVMGSQQYTITISAASVPTKKRRRGGAIPQGTCISKFDSYGRTINCPPTIPVGGVTYIRISENGQQCCYKSTNPNQ